MPNNVAKKLLTWCLVSVALGAGACTVSRTEPPPLTGPSTMAVDIRIAATPDRIIQDGASQSSIVVSVFGPDGRGVAGLALRVDMIVGGIVQDYGTLSARTIVTGSDGIARTVFTAPPPPPPLAGGYGTTVTILATPIGSNAMVSPNATTAANIALIMPGVIIAPAETPTAAFTFTPSPANFNVSMTFDGSRSCPGAATSTGACLASSSAAITSWFWDFGDGETKSGRTATHTFVSGSDSATTFTVTLTVTNDRGISASTTQQINVTASPAPTGDWVSSPLNPVIGDIINFNASAMRAAPGHFIVRYDWNFGDGTTGTGMITTHVYQVANRFGVTLTVTDDVGAKTTVTKTIDVGTAAPSAKLTLTKNGGLNITADGSTSTAIGGYQIVNYTFKWGDGSADTSGQAAVVPHTFPANGTYVVTLVVTDNFNPPRTGTVTASITVP